MTRARGSGDAWIRRYLTLLGIDATGTNLATLAAITRAHVFTIPFENVTSLLRRRDHPAGAVPAPDPDTLLQAWEQRSGGGVCFEIAPMLARLLHGLGYDIYIVLGQISVPSGHQAVLVELGGRRYLVDAGNGAPFLDPIPLERLPHQIHMHGLSFRFCAGSHSDEVIQERIVGGTWQRYCRFDLRPATDADRDAGYQHHHTPNASWVTNSLTVVRIGADAVHALKDATLTHHSARAKSIETLAGAAEYSRAAREVFGLPRLRIAEALAVRSTLSRREGGAATPR